MTAADQNPHTPWGSTRTLLLVVGALFTPEVSRTISVTVIWNDVVPDGSGGPGIRPHPGPGVSVEPALLSDLTPVTL